MTKENLIAFEKEVAQRFEAGDIRAPIHLSAGNEDQLIAIFKDVSPEDWVLSTWRNHYHALLHGIPPDELMRQILAARSMCVNSVEHRFYSSSIAGGILPIAVGLGMGIKRKKEEWQVWAFVGDMVAESGIFHESAKYAFMHDLPVTFVVEDNGKSVQTDTRNVWNLDSDSSAPMPFGGVYRDRNTIWYRYQLTWPHHGTGQFVNF